MLPLQAVPSAGVDTRDLALICARERRQAMTPSLFTSYVYKRGTNVDQISIKLHSRDPTRLRAGLNVIFPSSKRRFINSGGGGERRMKL